MAEWLSRWTFSQWNYG